MAEEVEDFTLPVPVKVEIAHVGPYVEAAWRL